MWLEEALAKNVCAAVFHLAALVGLAIGHGAARALSDCLKRDDGLDGGELHCVGHLRDMVVF